MKIRTSTLTDLKQKGIRFAALTSYDMHTASIFDAAGIEVLLVGDSASDNVLANQGTAPITLDEMIPFGKAVARSAKDSLVVFDLPFGSYEVSAEQALISSIRAMKETGAAAVKLEGAKVEQISRIVENGIPVMGHVGFTPQTVHALAGYKVQGRDQQNADRIMNECLAIQKAGAFAVVLEMIPATLAKEISEALEIPTIGIGAGSQCDGQILVWQDFAGLSEKTPKFAKNYLKLRDSLGAAAQEYRSEVQSGSFPPADKQF
jgi:3-methyl-2-oxobutanoate hydroxymethyltransferase